MSLVSNDWTEKCMQQLDCSTECNKCSHAAAWHSPAESTIASIGHAVLEVIVLTWDKFAGGKEGPAFPAAASSQVAERGLACCFALLKTCPIDAPAQAINLLQRFGAVAALPRDSATEEVQSRRLSANFMLLFKFATCHGG